MSLENLMIYSCSVCGHMLSGMEWEEHTKGEKDYKCPDCGADLNEDELYGEE